MVMLGDLFLWQADAHEQFAMHTFSSEKELRGVMVLLIEK